MDTPNTGSYDSIEGATERARGAESQAYVLIPFVPKDVARMRKLGRQDAAKVARLGALARGRSSDRDAFVEAARQKLLAGELEGRAVYASTAEKLASSGFLTG